MNALLVTGASSGIGLATASAFAELGWRVVNLSRRPVPIDAAVHISADLAEPDWDTRHAARVRAALEGSERICIVHNAGLLTKDRIDDLDGERLARVLQVNVVAPQQLNRIVLPQMRAGSSILYVGSTLGEKAVPGACAYVVSKHAQLGLMRATCQDLAGSGIHTACVCPGFTDTAMLRAHVGADEGVLSALAQGVAFGRLAEPDEIAATLIFCALNPVINGAVIHANLGQIER